MICSIKIEPVNERLKWEYWFA